jgi:hypothetical protein
VVGRSISRGQRPHKDVDVAVLRPEHEALLEHLAGWDLRIASKAQLRVWSGARSDHPRTPCGVGRAARSSGTSTSRSKPSRVTSGSIGAAQKCEDRWPTWAWSSAGSPTSRRDRPALRDRPRLVVRRRLNAPRPMRQTLQCGVRHDEVVVPASHTTPVSDTEDVSERPGRSDERPAVLRGLHVPRTDSRDAYGTRRRPVSDTRTWLFGSCPAGSHSTCGPALPVK